MKSSIKEHLKNSSRTLLSLLNYENDIIKISKEIIKCNNNKKNY